MSDFRPKLSVLAALTACGIATAVQAQPASRPNIIVIMGDDIGWATSGSLNYYNWFAYEFWRFVFVQQEVGKLAPMQQGASFNLSAVKARIDEAIANRDGR